MNPILNLLGKASPGMGRLGQIASAIKMAKDPVTAINQMAQTDPRMKQLSDILNQHGGNAQQAVYALAAQRGIDPDEVLKQAQEMFK